MTYIRECLIHYVTTEKAVKDKQTRSTIKGLHQGYSLRPYIFAIIMDVLTCGIKDIYPRGASYMLMALLCVAPEESKLKRN